MQPKRVNDCSSGHLRADDMVRNGGLRQLGSTLVMLAALLAAAGVPADRSRGTEVLDAAAVPAWRSMDDVPRLWTLESNSCGWGW
jgi:hypothetical protein